VLTEEPVEEILIDSGGKHSKRGKAVGVRTSKRRLLADAVVVNADFAEAMRKLIPNQHRRKWSDKKIASKQYSCSTFMMYLGIEGRYDDVAHHTIYLAENYRAEPLRYRGSSSALEESFVLRPECIGDGSDTGAEGAIDAVCTAAGDARKREGRLGA
jgi:phytoene desaturase